MSIETNPLMFIGTVCNNVQITTKVLMKENGFTLEKVRSRRYPSQSITDLDDTEDLVFLAITPVQVKSLLHRLEQAARGIGLYVNSEKKSPCVYIKIVSSPHEICSP